ncbi:calpain-15-like [Watersipora subatra]|uniref:calpain-15-like n=1 Tax=Watersipora subatra TaxID=2589382 RepID=UPI00355BA983
MNGKHNKSAVAKPLKLLREEQVMDRVTKQSGKVLVESGDMSHQMVVRPDKDGKLLFLRNVWGSKAFTGNWGPDSEFWKAVTDKSTLPESLGNASKGIFWISLEDFAEYFSTLVICYARENYHQYHIKAKIQQSGDDVWETFEVEVFEDTCLDFSFEKIEGVVSDSDAMLMIAFIFDDNEKVVGTTKCDHMQSAVWKAKLLNPGIYKVRMMAFSEWKRRQSTDYNLVVHSSREVACRKVAEPASELPRYVMRLAANVGQQYQEKDATFYIPDDDFWIGAVIVASNNNIRKETRCSILRSNYNNVVSTRTLGHTLDTLPPGHRTDSTADLWLSENVTNGWVIYRVVAQLGPDVFHPEWEVFSFGPGPCNVTTQ